MKKRFVCILCLLLLCTALPVSAWMGEVDTQATVTEVKAGDEVTFTVSVYGLQIKSLALKLGTAFDPEVFTFVSSKWLVKGLLSDVDTQKLNAVIAFTKETTLDNQAVFSFTLRVRQDASACDTRVGVTAVMSSADITQEVGQMASGCRMTVRGDTVTTSVTDATVVTTATTVLTGTADSNARPAVGQNSGQTPTQTTVVATTTVVTTTVKADSSAPVADATSVPIEEGTTASATAGTEPAPLYKEPPTTSLGHDVNGDAWLLLGVVAVALIAVAVIGIVLFRNKGKMSTKKGDSYGDSTE